MTSSICRFEGFRATTTSSRSALSQSPPSARHSCRTAFTVVAFKKANKRQQVVLTQDVGGLGKAGELKSVLYGYYRNHLLPQGYASAATTDLLEEIKARKEAELKAKAETKNKAKAMATALKTIGKFIIKKKVGEADQIFGSVTVQEIVDAITKQTGRTLEKKLFTVPEIKSLGTYEVLVKLHPEVVGTFKVVVQKQAQA